MGVCQMQGSENKKKKSIEKILESLKSIKDIENATKELFGQTKEVFEYIFTNQKLGQNITLKEYDFYSQKTEDLNTLKIQVEHFYNNYYRIVLTNIKCEDLYFYNNMTLKFALEAYLAMNTIKENKMVWWCQNYFYSREKLIQNIYELIPQTGQEQGVITPLLNFMNLLIKLSLKLLENEGIKIKVKEIENIPQTKGSSLYEQLKRDISI